jgi:hypothetical protein
VVMQWKSDAPCLHSAKLIQKVMLYFVVEVLEQEKNRCGVLYLRDLNHTFYAKDVCDVDTFTMASF